MLDSIFAKITGYSGSVSIIRLSGIDCIEFFKEFNISITDDRVSTFITIKHKDKFIDNALITYFKNPNSFTGEDVIEISLHSSPFVVEHMLSILSSIPNFRAANPGEFTHRAFYNNKIDLIQAEGINALIKSKTQSQHLLASKMITGQTSNVYADFKQNILDTYSLVETCIDFSDEDIPLDILSKARVNITQIISNITKHIKCNQNQEIILDGAKIAMCGKPNVGKSSLFNLLLDRDAAIVTNIEGTTRDSLEASIKINDMMINLIDTAGLRETSDAIEKIGIGKATDHINDADIKLIICTSELNIPDNINIEPNDIIVLNKIDINTNYNNNVQILQEQCPCTIVPISIMERINIDRLLKTITDIVTHITNFSNNSILITKRHISILRQIIVSLELAHSATEIEIIAEHMRYSMYLIGQISGHIKNDDIITNIFSHFCIGK